jgi:hypothetical protein
MMHEGREVQPRTCGVASEPLNCSDVPVVVAGIGNNQILLPLAPANGQTSGGFPLTGSAQTKFMENHEWC